RPGGDLGDRGELQHRADGQRDDHADNAPAERIVLLGGWCVGHGVSCSRDQSLRAAWAPPSEPRATPPIQHRLRYSPVEARSAPPLGSASDSEAGFVTMVLKYS